MIVYQSTLADCIMIITFTALGHDICDCIGTTGKNVLFYTQYDKYVVWLIIYYTVEVRANILQFNENSVKIQVDCNYTVISVDGVNLTISVNKAGSQLTLNRSLLCREDKSTTIIVNNLQRNTKYYVFALWTGSLYEKSRQCTLSMPFVGFETLKKSQGNY